ncbi:MAG TPA: hypothetical protein VF759_01240 [Allosphingosinicella sp.]|jgi:hypothetical protein
MKAKILAAAAAMLLLGPWSPPAAAAPFEAPAWAQCVWQRLPASAANFVALPRLKKGSYYGEESAGFRLLMRLQSACHSERPVPDSGNFDRELHRALQTAVIEARPSVVGADPVDHPAFRCEIFFEDDSAMQRVAGVDWGFGEDRTRHQLGSSRQIFAQEVSAADLAALLGSGKGVVETANRLLDVKPSEVDTFAAGSATGAPFMLRKGAGLRRCRTIRADGSLADA